MIDDASAINNRTMQEALGGAGLAPSSLTKHRRSGSKMSVKLKKEYDSFKNIQSEEKQ
jgi:hypothetical protein